MGQKEHVLSLEHDGKAYNLMPGEFNALDDRAVWQVTGGITIDQVFNGGAVNLFSIAALLWRHRVNNGEPDLSYVDVARTFTYDSIETLSKKPRAGGPPEAPGGGS